MATSGRPKPNVERARYGEMPDGTPVDIYTLTSGAGVTARVITYGGILTELHTPDRAGAAADIVLGLDTLDQYLAGHPHFGATVGRFANRIARARFTLDGVTYLLAANNGPNALHGGLVGFDKKVWAAEAGTGPDEAVLQLTCVSPAGEEGYPGTLLTTATYALTSGNELRLAYEAVTDEATVVNLTNHTYFNLGPGPDILGHVLTLAADRYTTVDATLIPTGDLAPLEGTPYDFTAPRVIGERIAAVGGDPSGYDHNYVLSAPGGEPFARLGDPATGRVVEFATTQPGVQFYTGNFLDGSIVGKGGRVYGKHAGLCLETQHFPDSPNKPQFPSTVLRPGLTYREATSWRFRVE